uniref:Internal virion protein n=1 Tax=viral metagenome TaxID=1070528 RepID=A0A6M3K7K8_9ZZZZ
MDPFTMLLLGGAQIGTSLFQGHQASKIQKRAEQQQQEQLQRARQLAGQVGTSGRRRINEQFTQLGGRLQSQLAQRGLSSSTAAAAGERVLGTDRERAMGELEDQIARMRIGIETGAASSVPNLTLQNQPNYGGITQGLGMMGMPWIAESMGIGQQGETNRMMQAYLSQLFGGAGGAGGAGMGYPGFGASASPSLSPEYPQPLTSFG